jgi:ribonucleoside-diphosphate reductase alpha chain
MNNKDYYWLNEESKLFLERGYLIEGETPHQRIDDIAKRAAQILGLGYGDFASKFKHYMARGYYSLSSPIWANFGRERGLPISCFSSFIPDSMEGILYKIGEVGIMSKMGGGTSGYFGAIRHRGAPISSGGTATGVHHQLSVFDSLVNYVSQGNVRRGSFAAYLPIDHKDIEEFLHIRSDGDDVQDISIGVCVSDEWMQSMLDGDTEKRKLWGKVIKKRFESGYPYIFYTDNVNKGAPEVYQEKDIRIHNSNLCSEIMLPTNPEESFVCNLSSINLERWDELEGTDAVETMIFFLDAVMSEFIDKTDGVEFMKHPRNFAIRHRALGLGVLGWHSYLQSKNIPFESIAARSSNIKIFKSISERTKDASKELSFMFGEPEVLMGYGMRNTTTMAVAPTTSSSFILGQVSPSIEPLNSNYFIKDLAKGKFTYRNPYLAKLFEERGLGEDAWRSVLKRGGSVQHLEELSDEEKSVFKTFGEISQRDIVDQAADRQKFIDQGQSLNITIPPNTSPKEVNELMIHAWERGIKSLYYQRSANPAQELARSINNCSVCEG